MGIRIDVQEGRHQICSFLCADENWIMSHLKKKSLEQMTKELIEEAERWVGRPFLIFSDVTLALTFLNVNMI